MFLRVSKFCALDLALGGRDRAGDALVLDRHVVGDLHRGQHPVDPVGLEQPHQVVLERQVEPGLARVALPAGATAQLVVDPARLVPLGADDVQAAGVVDLVVLGLDLLLASSRRIAGQAASYSSECSTGSRPWRRSSSSARNSTEPPSMMSVPRPAMLVATVTAPLRPACATIVRLARVLLGVEHRVRDAASLEQARTVLRLLDRTSCRPGPAGPRRAARRCRRRSRRTSRPRSGRRGRAGPRGSSAGWSGSGSRRAGRSCRTPRPRSWPYRSCRRASRRAGSSSAG